MVTRPGMALALESVRIVRDQMLDLPKIQWTLLGNTGSSYPGVIFPGSDAIFYNNNNFPNRNQQVVKQKARVTVRTTKRRAATTRRTPASTRRPAPTATTVRVNKVTNVNRKPVQTQKKPQSNDHIKN